MFRQFLKLIVRLAKNTLPVALIDWLRTIRDRFKMRRIGIRLVATPLQMAYYGSDYGGYAVPPSIVADKIGLCFGAGEDITFEHALASELRSQVHMFDPTPRSIEYCLRKVSEFDESDKSSGGSLVFHPVGVWSETKTLRFYGPEDPKHISHSILNLQSTKEYFNGQVLSPNDILTRVGASTVCFVKLNIEGAEYEVIKAFFESAIRPRVICINFDELHSPMDSDATDRLRKLVGRFNAESYVPTHIYGTKATFLRMDDSDVR